MKFFADLGTGGTLEIENTDLQTLITLTSHSIDQQQSQQMSIYLGNWSASPTLFQLPSYLILQIETPQRTSFVRLQSNSISLLTEMPLMLNAKMIPLRNAPPSAPATVPSKIEMPKAESMKPIEPLKPLRTSGNVAMRTEPMEKRMKNMSVRLELSTSTQTSAQTSLRTAAHASIPVCSKCGTEVHESDRCCTNCGHSVRT
jgi:hypothetical protein